MGKQFKTERASQQQSLICRGLVELLLKDSFFSITVGDICSLTGIPRRTFYYYFNCKEDVLFLLLDQVLKEADLETMLISKAPGSQLHAAFTNFFLYWRDRRQDVLRALVRNNLEQELISRCLNWVQTELPMQAFPEKYTPEMKAVVMRLGVTAVFYTLFNWCRSDFRQSPEYMADCVSRLLVEPIYYYA